MPDAIAGERALVASLQRLSASWRLLRTSKKEQKLTEMMIYAY